MHYGIWRAAALGVTAWIASVATASALSIGLTDNFEDGTTQNWLVGLLGAVSPLPPTNVTSGGPAGADDNYLLLQSKGGGGPGSRLAVINLDQWAGNYLATGVGGIAVDLNNQGSTNLSIRFLLENPIGGPPTDEAITAPFLLPANSGWTRALFAIGPGQLTALQGNVNTLLANVTLIRIIHNAAGGGPEPIVATLGVDNITAVGAVPEPATLLLVGGGLLGLGATRRRFFRR